MPALLQQRLAKLEAAARQKDGAARRLISLVVRKGREEKDQAQAYREAGIVPTDHDFCIIRLILSPDPDDAMQDIRPSAMVLAPMKSIRGNHHGR